LLFNLQNWTDLREFKRRISVDIQRVIIDELKKDKELIDDLDIPINRYNYSYLRERISKEKGIEVSLSTIIKIAKENGFYIARRRQKVHNREVITRYVGELIQHDTSHHLFAPLSNTKWYLITSIEDYSRVILQSRFG
jgi:intein-encoded DNA endonuclease-like protein